MEFDHCRNLLRDQKMTIPPKTQRQERIEAVLARTSDRKLWRLLNREWWREFFAQRPRVPQSVPTPQPIVAALDLQPEDEPEFREAS